MQQGSFLIKVFIAVSAPFSPLPTAPHTFCYVVFLFSFTSNYFIISRVTSLIHLLFKIMWSNLHTSVNFPGFSIL